MAYLHWLPQVLRDAGVPVRVLLGAEGRSTRASGLVVNGIVWHHTATGPAWSDQRVAELLRDGRADLSGPLAQVGLERDGTWVIIALGRCNHNGYGTWGNDSLGIEMYNSGTGEPWPPVQYDSAVRGTKAVLDHLNKTALFGVMGHKETDPNRKIDPAGIDMNKARNDIANTLIKETVPDMDAAQDARLKDIDAKVDKLFDAFFKGSQGVASSGNAARRIDATYMAVTRAESPVVSMTPADISALADAVATELAARLAT